MNFDLNSAPRLETVSFNFLAFFVAFDIGLYIYIVFKNNRFIVLFYYELIVNKKGSTLREAIKDI